VLAGTGLRPEELWGLERRHFDRKNGVLAIEQVYTQGRLKPCKKSDLQRRRVPLRAKVLEALDAMPTRNRFDGPLFPGHDGGYVKHDTFRLRHWDPALRAGRHSICDSSSASDAGRGCEPAGASSSSCR
jgi:integrase